MQSFEELAKQFAEKFSQRHFPEEPASLYGPCEYFLQLGGKRIRPVSCLMGNELFEEIIPDAWHAATAIELFHNFTLVHDDIMDKAPLRRGLETVHAKFGESTALLTGDVMLVVAYDYLNKIKSNYLHRIIRVFNKTAKEVCEGQQLDMDFARRAPGEEGNGTVKLDEYIRMIELKTSVLLAGSLQMGSILGGAGERNQNLIYDFGRKLGIAFQIQDDYLDAFGDPQKFGKQAGGDIKANKKTFLLIHAVETTNAAQRKELLHLMSGDNDHKVEKILQIYKDCKADEWARQLKNKYLDEAFIHLEDIAVLSKRKDPLRQLAHFLVLRDY